MYEDLSTFKERVFQECFQEDLAMVEQWSRQVAMMGEDMKFQSYRHR